MIDAREKLTEEFHIGEVQDCLTTKTYKETFHRPTWNVNGWVKRIQESVDSFGFRTGIEMPYNLAKHGPTLGYRVGKYRYGLNEWGIHDKFFVRDWNHEYDPNLEGTTPELCAKYCGWLESAHKFPMLTRLIEKTLSPHGMNCTDNYIDLYAVASRWSPGAAERQIRKVRFRANHILEPYGLKVSWGSLAFCLEKGRRARGKAAVQAAALTINCLTGGQGLVTGVSYRDARAFMAEAKIRNLKMAMSAPAPLKTILMVNGNLSGSKLSWENLSGVDLSGRCLSGADLEGTDIHGANLQGADLSGANLQGANLSAANLRGANLKEANLSGANLQGVGLVGSCLRNSDLQKADLFRTELGEADLRGANLENAYLLGAYYNKDTEFSEGVIGSDLVRDMVLTC